MDVNWQEILTDFQNIIISLVDIILLFLSSHIFMTILGTFAAAFAGAYGAQFFIDKKQKNDAILDEIRNTNSAIVASFSICNSCLSLKKQYVKSLKEDHDSKRKDLDKFLEEREKRLIKPEKQFELRADFQTISPLVLPVEILERQVFEKISTKARAQNLTSTLISTIQSLNSSINQRNKLIGLFKEQFPMEDGALVRFYFGLPDNNGHVDNNYPDSINAIYSQTDDCIFFSKLLCSDLHKHGISLKEQLDNKSIVINKADFEIARNNDLLPDPENYNDWVEMFK